MLSFLFRGIGFALIFAPYGARNWMNTWGDMHYYYYYYYDYFQIFSLLSMLKFLPICGVTLVSVVNVSLKPRC